MCDAPHAVEGTPDVSLIGCASYAEEGLEASIILDRAAEFYSHIKDLRLSLPSQQQAHGLSRFRSKLKDRTQTSATRYSFMEFLEQEVPARGRRIRERTPFVGNKTAYTIRLALAKVRQKYLHPRLSPDHARLLVLHPPMNGLDELNIELVPVSFSDLGTKYQYEALSYHWGGEQGLRTVYVRSAQEARTMDKGAVDLTTPHTLRGVANKVLVKKMWLKTNLYAALRRLRMPARPVVLWVDAICIDQDNAKEKDDQVARMVEIYSRASRVVIWLGDEDDRSRSAMKFIQDIVRVDNLDGLVADHKTIKSWSDLVFLMQNPWFSRRWVIQEMAYAKAATVHLAELALPWDDFRDAVSLFVLNLDKIRALLQPLLELSTGLGQGLLLHDNLGNMDFLLSNNLDGLPAKVFIDVLDYMFRKPKGNQKPNPIHGLEFLVSTLYIYNNSDPRDTINALRNIAKETSPQARGLEALEAAPKPDYTKNLFEVYSDFVEWVVNTTGSLDIICRRWALPEKEKGNWNYPTPVRLPSWIQVTTDEERMRRGIKSDSFVGLPGQRIYDASKEMKAYVDFSFQQVANGVMLPNGVMQSEHIYNEETSRMNGENSSGASFNTFFKSETTTSRVNHSLVHEHYYEQADYYTGNDSVERRLSDASSIDESAIEGILIVPPSLRRRERDASIIVRGLRIGILNWATDPITDGVIPDIALRKMRRKMRATAPGEPPEQLWRTLVAERGEDGRNPPPWYHRACRYCLMNKSPNGHLNTDNLLSQTQPGIVRAFLKRVQAVTWNRRIVEVHVHGEEPMYGLAPAQSREGDLVSILFGCSVPCILRLCQDDDGRYFYSFIGEACIYGLMDGEAITAMSSEELIRRTYAFRLL